MTFLVRRPSCDGCSAGKYQSVIGQTACNECTPGGWCKEGAGAPEDCPGGTYSPRHGLVNSTQCRPCPLGFYCPVGTLEPIVCNVTGFWCPEGSSSPAFTKNEAHQRAVERLFAPGGAGYARAAEEFADAARGTTTAEVQ